MTPKLIFKIDPEKELEYLLSFETDTDYRDTWNTMPSEVRHKIWKTGMDAMKSELIDLIENEWNFMLEDGKNCRDIFKEREEEWRKIEKEYFTFAKNILEIDWPYEEYTCYGSVFSYVNIYRPKLALPEILITIFDRFKPNQKTGHELFHSLQIYSYKQLLTEEEQDLVTDNFFETSLLLAFTDKTSPFDETKEHAIQRRIDQLGQDLSEEIKVLEKLWDERTSYKDYLMKYIELRKQEVSQEK